MYVYTYIYIYIYDPKPCGQPRGLVTVTRGLELRTRRLKDLPPSIFNR